ncbi:MAG: M23 family metallopeptidase, partial [Opitutaceae bacterium]|nr:M23 family metallopeptidase [Opitutaceae bacterium]
MELSWPTPNEAHSEGRPFKEYIQPTVSGYVYSGLYGCVRSNGYQFHEGIDLKSIQRNKQGEATDRVMAINAGSIRYINRKAGNSNYGRYIVIEHSSTSLSSISLYAHLQSIDTSLIVGDKVGQGQFIGIMGRTANGHGIPKKRAHLHLEIGFRLTDSFQDWYDRKGYQSKNKHGNFNGLNLVGIDFLDFYERLEAKEVEGLIDYLKRQQTALSVIVKSKKKPDFLDRYSCFLSEPVKEVLVAGWQIDFTWFGVPVKWTPLYANDVRLAEGQRDRIVFHDEALLKRYPCNRL